MNDNHEVECWVCGKKETIVSPLYTLVDSNKGEDDDSIKDFHKCSSCLDQYARTKRMLLERQIRQLESPIQPSWFDPSYAGERWDSD